MEKISVIIPTYNRAHCVCSAIDSVLKQSYKNIEIIVVDDGSTDQTNSILKGYGDKIFYLYQNNKGVSAARNLGIKFCTADWVAFLDSDDEWLPNKIEKQIEDMKNFPHSIVYCTNVLFKDKNNAENLNYFSSCNGINSTTSYLIKKPLYRLYSWTSSVIANKSKINEVGFFDEEMNLYEDIDLFYRLATRGTFTANPTPLVEVYRRNEPQSLNLSIVSSENKIINYTNIIRIFRKLLIFAKNNQQKRFIHQKLSEAWFDLGISQYENGEILESIQCFFSSFRINPSFKSFIKFSLGITGRPGIKLIKNRRKSSKGFRRSEFYLHD